VGELVEDLPEFNPHRLVECIELAGAIDLDMGYGGGRRGNDEVFEMGVAFSRHGDDLAVL
jgi:hypothetical protein